MSCPYFDPIERSARGDGAQLALLPLGDAWTGTCHADPSASVTPDDSTLRSLCNLGYARGTCSRFPAGDPGPDAARFTISADDGASIRIYYVLERDHQPFAHGALQFPLHEETIPGLTLRQARAYFASYMRRKTAAGGR